MLYIIDGFDVFKESVYIWKIDVMYILIKLIFAYGVQQDVLMYVYIVEWLHQANSHMYYLA
jgi:hypothetical protein